MGIQPRVNMTEQKSLFPKVKAMVGKKFNLDFDDDHADWTRILERRGKAKKKIGKNTKKAM
jgi:hypothetical protein